MECKHQLTVGESDVISQNQILVSRAVIKYRARTISGIVEMMIAVIILQSFEKLCERHNTKCFFV